MTAFFNRFGKFRAIFRAPDDLPQMQYLSVEELYQAFKERAEAEAGMRPAPESWEGFADAAN